MYEFIRLQFEMGRILEYHIRKFVEDGRITNEQAEEIIKQDN